jgi:oxygen-independent coproporphyrinogen-3 oxidase
MIEESQSTFGLGGGAITKYTNGAFDEEIELERIVNPKEPIAYINEMRDRFEKKKKIFEREN